MTQQQRRTLDELLRHGPLDVGGDIAEQRALFHEMISSVPLPEDVTATPGELGGVPVVTVATPGIDPSLRLLYFHGGAYALGSAADSVGLAADVARRVGAPAVSVGYRLAPEHPFPAALEDAVAVYRALLDEGVPSSRIAFVGESAGGGLVVAALVALEDAGLPQPASAAVFSPWADLTVSGASAAGRAALDPALTAEALRTRARDYLGESDPATPLASPIFADLTGLPPLLVQVGSHEILLDDAVRLAARAGEHDVAVQLQVWPGVPHVFQGFAALLDDADQALSSAAAFLARYWGAAKSSWVALRTRIDFQAGQSVLVPGATGNAGRMAVEVAKLLGAGRVVAAGRNPERLAELPALDADAIVNLADGPDALASVAADVDVVLDYVWGETTADAIVALVTARTDRSKPLTWVEIGPVSDSVATLPSAAFRAARLHLVGSGVGSVPARDFVGELPALAERIMAGSFAVDARPVPLADVEQAWADTGVQRVVIVPVGAPGNTDDTVRVWSS